MWGAWGFTPINAPSHSGRLFSMVAELCELDKSDVALLVLERNHLSCFETATT